MLRLRALGGAAVVSICAFAETQPAEACGGFFSPRDVRKPSLAYEQVLIAYDEASQREDFIREVTFERANTSFGFVVPTPSQPEVAKVAQSPFPALRGAFPFAPNKGRGLDGIGTIGHGRGAGFGARGVEVLDVKKVGSFTAFVLRADDATALAQWLAKNKLVSSKESDAWLEHYVKLKFYYVAMRYDPPRVASTASRVASETVRISFNTPAPYYPYYEPTPAPDAPVLPRRLLDLWLVSSSLYTPVALHQEEGGANWVRPMRSGERHTPPPRELLDKTLSTLLPTWPYFVQTFQDQKVSRQGFGDIVFLPRQSTEQSARAAVTARLHPLFALLDPSLLEGK